MKKSSSIFVFLVFLLALFAGTPFCQQVDLSGKWVGQTEVPNAAEPDKLTVVLEKKEGGYKGKISDSMGMLQDTELEDLEFKDNKLTCNFLVNTGESNLKVNMTLTVEGDKMKGNWEAEDGSSGSVELEREK
jgi:hypothetical protein